MVVLCALGAVAVLGTGVTTFIVWRGPMWARVVVLATAVLASACLFIVAGAIAAAENREADRQRAELTERPCPMVIPLEYRGVVGYESLVVELAEGSS